MIGKRRDPQKQDDGGYELLAPGEYGKPVGLDEWWCCTPNGFDGNLIKHQVVEHEDGTITVSPSILIYQTARVSGERTTLWHGFLEHGVWREC